MIIAVDFDGTCVTHEYPEIGKDIGAQKVLKKLVDNKHKIILWTMRSGKELQDAVDWFKVNGIPLFGINVNPEQATWTTSPKAYAQLYIDDAALGCPLNRKPEQFGKRPYVYWPEIKLILIEMQLIKI